MTMIPVYPGTPRHQVFLCTLVSHYAHDPRILAIVVFGSLGRGTWDACSDLDLDIIIADGVEIDMTAEWLQLSAAFAAIQEPVALLIPDGEEADVVFQSLIEMSIRYHPLSTTSPNIVDSFQLLMGHIDRAVIEAAGLANRHGDDEPLTRLLDRCIRYVLQVDIALQRRQIWSAVELLHRIRGLLMTLFTQSHHGQRTYHFFQAEADSELQARLGATLPRYELDAVHESLRQVMDILYHDLEWLTEGQVKLTEVQVELLRRIALRQTGCQPWRVVTS